MNRWEKLTKLLEWSKDDLALRVLELENDMEVAVEALCRIENATDSHALYRNDDLNKIVWDALEKIRSNNERTETT